MTYITFSEDNIIQSIKQLIECGTPDVALAFYSDCLVYVLGFVPKYVTNLAIFVCCATKKTSIKIPASVTHLEINNSMHLFEIPKTVKHLLSVCKYAPRKAKIPSETIVYTWQSQVAYSDSDGNGKMTKPYSGEFVDGYQEIKFGYGSAYIPFITDDVPDDIIISDEILERLIQESEEYMTYVRSIAKQILERLEQLSACGKLHSTYAFSISLYKNIDKQFVEDLRKFVPATKIQLKVRESFLGVKIL